MNALWIFGEIVDSLAAILFLVLGLSGSLYAYGFVGPGPFRRFRWRAEHRATLRWLAPLLVVLSAGVLLLQVREFRTSWWSPNEAVQATAATPFLFEPRGDLRLLGFVVAQLPAAVPDLARWPKKPCL